MGHPGRGHEAVAGPPLASPAVIPRHEWPGRHVLTVGLITSGLCVVSQIVVLLG